MSDDLRVNGNLVSWGSHIFKANGERWFGVTAIDWDEKRERAYGYGMARHHKPIGRTAGKYTPGPLKITFHKHSAIKFREMLRALTTDQISIGNVEIPMLLQVQEGDITSTTVFDRCTLATRTGKAEENADPNMVELEFNSMGITEDDTTLYDSTEGG